MCVKFLHFDPFSLSQRKVEHFAQTEVWTPILLHARWLPHLAIHSIGAVAQWYSQRTSVLEVAGSTPAPIIVELLWLKISHNLG